MVKEGKTKNTPAPASTVTEEENSLPESLNTKCSICSQIFETVQECLKHELLEHSLKKVYTKTGVDGRLKATAKYLNSKEKKEERNKIHDILETCPKGQELPKIFKILCMNTECLGLIFTRIQTCLEKELMPLGQVRIYPFGSIASGLALRDSDIDIFMDVSNVVATDFGNFSKNRRKTPKDVPDNRLLPQQRGAFNRLSAALQRSPLFSDVFPVRAARVPIIKCKHRDTGFSIDINISCPSSMANTYFISSLVQSDRRIQELFVFLKLWAKNMQIIGRSNMTSYCLITMIIFYLQQPLEHSSGGGVGKKTNQKILNSIRELQRQCAPLMVQGINYAFDLQSNENKPRIPKGSTTFDLIKGFFHFYKDYDFEENLISPFYGRTIPKNEFTEEKFKEYSKQLVSITHHCEGVPADPIQLDRCMCVQDSFGLNYNVARTMLPPNKKYFILCLERAAEICEGLPHKEMIEKLLYESFCKSCPASEKTVSILKQTHTPSNEVNTNCESNKLLEHLIVPSKLDLNCVAKADPSLTDSESILRFWCQHYITAIQNMLTDFYHMDLQTRTHTSQKQQRLDNGKLSQCWDITASVDLWSNRFFQKSAQHTFWEYQMAQTERLHSLRRQDPKFAVQLNAILTIDTKPGYTSLNVYVALPDDCQIQKLNKKDPLRKFFNVFKNTLQNYSIKDALSEGRCEKKAEENLLAETTSD